MTATSWLRRRCRQTPNVALAAGQAIGVAPDRCYPSGQALIDAEAERPDGAEVVAIMTPNDSHFTFAMQALERGLDVICDKPMTNTLDEATALHQRVQDTGLVFLPHPQLHRLPHGAPGQGHGGGRCSWARSVWCRWSMCKAAEPKRALHAALGRMTRCAVAPPW